MAVITTTVPCSCCLNCNSLAGLFGVSSVLLTVPFGTLQFDSVCCSFVARFDNLSGTSAIGTVLSIPSTESGYFLSSQAQLSIYNDNNACYLSVWASCSGTGSALSFSNTPFSVIQNPLPISGSGTVSYTTGLAPNQFTRQGAGTFTLE